MNPLPHIISKVTRQPWVITGEKLTAIIDVLEARQLGEFRSMDYPKDGEHEDDSGRSDYREFQTPAGVVAVIPVHGILGKHISSLEAACGGCSLDTLQSQLKTALSSPHISRVLLDINSPGGTVTGTPETAKLIATLAVAKPVWAYTDSESCSGALWLAEQCSNFYASESSSVGSCGVRMVLLDYTRKLEQDGVQVNAIASGKYKVLGAPFKALTEEERGMLQSESDRIHQEFQKAVNNVRPIADGYLQGQVYRGEEAAGYGFTDGVVNDIDEVIYNLGHY